MNSRETARAGEDAAARFLEDRGYRLLVRNYRTRFGEIDIICRLDSTIVFVEVKTRSSVAYGYPSEAVTHAKQRKIINTAMRYVSEQKLFSKCFQFDVIEVYMEHGLPRINHIANAFGR